MKRRHEEEQTLIEVAVDLVSCNYREGGWFTEQLEAKKRGDKSIPLNLRYPELLWSYCLFKYILERNSSFVNIASKSLRRRFICSLRKLLTGKIMPTTADLTSKLSNLLPTGTFLTFQVLAPLATNNGNCGATEKALTVATLVLLAAGCIATSYTDSYEAPNGHVYTGVVTIMGLWVGGLDRSDNTMTIEDAKKLSKTKEESIDHNVDIKTHPSTCTCFHCSGIHSGSSFVDQVRFRPNMNDFLNASLSVISFLTLTMFTTPVSTCFYPHISDSLLKTLPLLVALVVGFFCSFSPRVRHGIGYALPTTKSDKADATKPLKDDKTSKDVDKTTKDVDKTAPNTKDAADHDAEPGQVAVEIHPVTTT